MRKLVKGRQQSDPERKFTNWLVPGGSEPRKLPFHKSHPAVSYKLTNPPIFCVACKVEGPEIVVISGLRRTLCQHCGHSQRIDIERFDYSSFAMGRTGVTSERLAAQAAFILPHLQKKAYALELGCAAGDLAQELRTHKKFEAYHGVEISPAREKAAERIDRVFSKPLIELLDNNEIKDAAYDIVLSSHFLEHVEDPFDTILTMKRALKKNGLLFLETPNRSGHARLPFDDNRSHIHFFCSASLTRILARAGFETIALETGARLDARYSDCLRVMAQWSGYAPKADILMLSCTSKVSEADKFVIWGAGRMVDEMLVHYFDARRIAFFVDKDVRKLGSKRMGAPVLLPAALKQGSGWCIIINSLEMEKSIRQEIAEQFSDRVARIISVAELLDQAASATDGNFGCPPTE